MAEGKISRHLNWQEVAIEDIQPYKNNPKAHTLKQIAFVAKLIETYGWTQPICLDKDYMVVFGHCRLESAKSLGEATVPCVFREDLTEAEVKALRIADNKSNESDWIEERLEIELVELQAMDIDLVDVGFGLEEVRGGGHVEEDDFNMAGSLEEEPITQVGDLWLLSDHRVLCGDSTKAEDVERVMGGVKHPVLFTDPPYGIDRDPAWLNAVGTLRQSLSSIDKIVGDDGSLDYSFLWLYERRMVWGFPYLYDVNATGWIVWDKQPGVDKRGIVTPIEMASTTMRRGFDMVRCMWGGYYRAAGEEKMPHPTQKPIGVIAPFIEAWTGESDNIVDFFLGSGSTLIAADKCNRNCVGLELLPKYCDITAKRYINHVGHSEDVFVERDGVKIAYSEVMANV